MTDVARSINYNLFAYPSGYFEEHTAEGLGITEEERSAFIEAQQEANRKAAHGDRGEGRKRRLDDFISEMELD